VATTDVPATTPDRDRPLPIGTRTHALGLSFVSLAQVSLGLLTLAAGGYASDGVFHLVVAAVFGAMAVLALRVRGWTVVLSILLTVVYAPFGAWTLWGLVAPASPADFVPAVLTPVGIVLSLTGGLHALLSRRRGWSAGEPTSGELWVRSVGVVVVLAATVVSTGLNLAGRGEVDALAARGATRVVMGIDDFDPPVMHVRGGRHAALLVRNEDVFLHDLTLPDHGVEIVLAPGSEALVDVSHLARGRYTVYCVLHSDTVHSDPELAGMAGTLIVD
jgi:hypothetical protein